MYRTDAQPQGVAERPAIKYNDWPWIIAFFAHLVAMIGIFGFFLSDVSSETESNNNSSDSEVIEDTLTPAIPIIIVCAIIGGVVGAVWMALMRYVTKQFVWGVLFTTPACWIVLAIYFLSTENSKGAAVPCILFALISLVMTYLLRKKVPFTIVLCRTSAMLIPKYWGSYVVTGCEAASMFFYFLFFIVLVILALISLAVLRDDSNSFIGLFFVTLFSLYWTANVIKLVAHTTICGSVSTWYFLSGTPFESTCESPTPASFKRATTTSFGTICAGGLIIAILQTIHALINTFARGALRCICASIIGSIKALVELFSTNLFAFVAIYGQPLRPAARNTKELLVKEGMTAVANAHVLGTITFLGSCISGLLALIVSVAMVTDDMDPLAVVFAVILGFLMALLVTWLILTPIPSACVALFVCISCEPHRMAQHDAEFAEIINQKRQEEFARQQQAQVQ